MRTLRKSSRSGTAEYVEVSQLPTTLADMLAVFDLESLTITRRDGSTLTYSALEYSCLACGEYGHTALVCPQEEEEEEK